MTMYRQGTGSGKIEQFTAQNDGAIVCQACSRIIVSSDNLVQGKNCPFCHNPVNKMLGSNDIASDDNSDVIAEPC